MRIKSWEPVAEVWGTVVPWSGHRARIWDLGTGVQCLGMWGQDPLVRQAISLWGLKTSA